MSVGELIRVLAMCLPSLRVEANGYEADYDEWPLDGVHLGNKRQSSHASGVSCCRG